MFSPRRFWAGVAACATLAAMSVPAMASVARADDLDSSGADTPVAATSADAAVDSSAVTVSSDDVAPVADEAPATADTTSPVADDSAAATDQETTAAATDDGSATESESTDVTDVTPVAVNYPWSASLNAGQQWASPGDTVPLNLYIRNDGSSTVTDVVVTFTPPSGSATLGDTATCDSPFIPAGGGVTPNDSAYIGQRADDGQSMQVEVTDPIPAGGWVVCHATITPGTQDLDTTVIASEYVTGTVPEGTISFGGSQAQIAVHPQGWEWPAPTPGLWGAVTVDKPVGSVSVGTVLPVTIKVINTSDRLLWGVVLTNSFQGAGTAPALNDCWAGAYSGTDVPRPGAAGASNTRVANVTDGSLSLWPGDEVVCAVPYTVVAGDIGKTISYSMDAVALDNQRFTYVLGSDATLGDSVTTLQFVGSKASGSSADTGGSVVTDGSFAPPMALLVVGLLAMAGIGSRWAFGRRAVRKGSAD